MVQFGGPNGLWLLLTSTLVRTHLASGFSTVCKSFPLKQELLWNQPVLHDRKPDFRWLTPNYLPLVEEWLKWFRFEDQLYEAATIFWRTNINLNLFERWQVVTGRMTTDAVMRSLVLCKSLVMQPLDELFVLPVCWPKSKVSQSTSTFIVAYDLISVEK